MQTTFVKLYSLNYHHAQTYWTALLFITGNMVLPQLFHLLPNGGITWLPIYFFTLIGAYKYGWKVGLLTAIFSPLINSWYFGMPDPIVLPSIFFKSVLLAFIAGYVSYRFRRISLPIMILVVLSYQILGTLGEWGITGSFHTAIQDFRLGMPGMALQVIGGYLFIKYILYK